MGSVRELPVVRHLETPLLPRIWGLRSDLTAFEAACVALAEALGYPLVTFKVALAEEPRIRAPVELLGGEA